MTAKTLPVILTTLVLAMAGIVLADISPEKAVDIGKDNIKKLTDQSYHYRIEYDTVLTLPVHSKTIWKNDFYLLYFLKDNQFQAEVEVDRETGKPTLLAMYKMAPPYYELFRGNFCHRFFNVDSIMNQGYKRFRMRQDSVRMVYYGVIPKLGKRGVVWELFSREGRHYITTGGMNLLPKQILRDMNTSKYQLGNYLADSLKLIELKGEITRLTGLTDRQLPAVKLDDQSRGEVIDKYKAEMDTIYVRFPKLRKIVFLEENQPPDTTK